MNTEQIQCYSCGSVFYVTNRLFASGKCNVCQQTEALEKQAASAREQEYFIHQQNIQLAAAQAILQVEAIERQTKTIVESSTSSTDAYDRGYNYIDYEFAGSNPAGLRIEIEENGTFTWHWNNLYITDRLILQFKKGLNDRMNSTKGADYDYLVSNAWMAGNQIAKGLLSPHFTLHTNVEINGIAIPSVEFQSNFTTTLDESTGELKMAWNEPFVDTALNESFRAGVSEYSWEVNTEENKKHRLANEVAELHRERIKQIGIKSTDSFMNFLYWLIPIILCPLIVYFASGWTMLFLLAAVVGSMVVALNWYEETWKIKNWKYLYETF